MCGRYYVEDETTREIERIVQHIDMSLKPYQREIYPDSDAPVITGDDHGSRLHAKIYRWGFPKFKGTGVIFNARAETALEKNFFRRSLMERRCVIPAKHFYEWDGNKNKIAFFNEAEPIIYMAGFYNCFSGVKRYTILTTVANISIQDVHGRMPVMLNHDEITDWIYDNGKMELMLSRIPYNLTRK